MSSGLKDEKPLALRVWSLNGGVIRIQLTRLADFADGDAIHGAIHAFTKALAGSRAPSDAALVEALEAVEDELCDRFLRPDSAERARCSRCGGEAFSPEGISHRTGCVVGQVQAALAAAKGQP